jgi:hypothetical protein
MNDPSPVDLFSEHECHEERVDGVDDRVPLEVAVDAEEEGGRREQCADGADQKKTRSAKLPNRQNFDVFVTELTFL